MAAPAGELGETLVAAIKRRSTTVGDNVDPPVLVQADQFVQQKELVVLRDRSMKRLIRVNLCPNQMIHPRIRRVRVRSDLS